MLKTVVKKGSYHDSVVLMLLTNEISAMDGVQKVQIMMATPANKDIFLQAGLDTEELRAATPNDMVIVADVESDDVTDRILKAVEAFFEKQSSARQEKKDNCVRSWERALEQLPGADLR